MRITPRIVEEVVRVYKDKFPRSMRDRWEKPSKKKRRSKEKKDRNNMCVDRPPHDGMIDIYK